MPSSRASHKFIFSPYIDRLISSIPTDVRALVPKEVLYSRIIDLIGTPLVYLINEKRLARGLVGETCWDRYDHFNSSAVCEQVMIEMRERFPFMWRRLRFLLDTLFNVVSQVREYLAIDSQELMDVGLLDEEWVIKRVIPAGDFHGGSCNARVEFGDGSSVYFKNRSSDAEALVHEVFSLVNKPGLGPRARITPPCLSRDAYSWVGSIDREPLERQSDAGLFYNTVGCLLFVSYLLSMTDLHHENVVPTSRCLKVIDCETALTQNVCIPSNPLDGATLKANRLLSESVLGTAMLPVGTANDLYGGDISGLGDGNYLVQQRVLKDPFRDDMRYVREYVKKEDKRHLPFFMDQCGEEAYAKPNDYIEEIIRGFRDSYNLAIKRSDELAALIRVTDINSRILYRKTADYQSMLEFVSSIRFSDNYIEKLRNLLKGATDLDNDVVDSELKQLMDGAIPAFYASSMSGRIVDSYGHVVGKLAIPSTTRCLRRIDSLSSEDMKRQIEFIECSLGIGEKISFKSRRMSHYKPEGEGSLRDALINILNRYKESCIRCDRDGTINWISLGVSDHDQLEATPLQKGVYSGVAGVGISLLSAYRIIPNDEILNLIQQIYKTCSIGDKSSKVNTVYRPYSYYMGAPGIIEFMLECDHLGIGYGNGRYELSQLVKRYAESDLHDVPTDVISGLAGTCIALCSLKTFDPTAVDVIMRFSDHILDSNLSKWQTHKVDASDNASFAHGASGFATALLNAYVLTKRDRFLDGFRLAWDYEECFRNGDSWRDTRRSDGLPSAHWCHGLSGLLLARDNWLRLDRKYDLFTTDERAKLEVEIESLKHGVISYGLRIDNLCLCHGVSGNLAVLSQVAPALDLSREWKRLAAFGVRYGWLCGLNSGIQSMSAMTGLAGIMDSLARQIKGDPRVSCLLFPALTIEEA